MDYQHDQKMGSHHQYFVVYCFIDVIGFEHASAEQVPGAEARVYDAWRDGANPWYFEDVAYVGMSSTNKIFVAIDSALNT